MADEMRIELYRAHQSMQDRYAYFLLAAAGASTGFAITQTTSSIATLPKILLAIAVMCWALSFFFGCRARVYASSTVYRNSLLLEVKAGVNQIAGNHPEAIQLISDDLRKEINKNNLQGAKHTRIQFYFLLWGAAFYVAWHMAEMWHRTPGVMHPAPWL